MTAQRQVKPGWRTVALSDVATNSTTATKDPEGEGFERYIVGKDIPSDGGQITTWSQVGDGLFGSRIRTIVEDGDVICTTRGPNLRVARSTFRCLGAHTNFVLRTASEDELLQDYLALVVESDDFQQHLRRNFRGSVNLFVNWSDAAKYKFALPPLDEQKRIAALISSIDQETELLAHCVSALRVLSLAEGAAMLAGATELATLGEVAEVVGGVTKDVSRAKSDRAVLVPYLRVANVQRGFFDLEELTEIHAEPKVVEKLALRDGDVLLNEGGDRDQLGRGWVWKDSGQTVIHQNHVFRARLHDTRCSPLVVAWMANYGNPRWFERNGKQTTNLASINLTSIRKFPVPLLHADQLMRFEEVMRSLIALERAVAEKGQAIRRLRSTLLSGSLEGTF